LSVTVKLHLQHVWLPSVIHQSIRSTRTVTDISWLNQILMLQTGQHLMRAWSGLVSQSLATCTAPTLSPMYSWLYMTVVRFRL